MVITGRVWSWPRDVEPLDLDVLAPEDAQRFLSRRLPDAAVRRPTMSSRRDCLAKKIWAASAWHSNRRRPTSANGRSPLAEYRRRWAADARNVRAWPTGS